MSKWTRQDDIDEIEKQQINKYGFVRWKIGHRYGYTAIDEMNKKGGCLRTHRSGMTHGRAIETIYDLLTD